MSKQVKFKFSDAMLLQLALGELKVSKRNFQSRWYNKLKLQHAQFLLEQKIVSGKTFVDQQMFSTDYVYQTPNALIKTTKYNRIKEIELKKKRVKK